MKLTNTTIYADEDAIDFMVLNGWNFEKCIFKDVHFEKKGLQNLENVVYCSSKHIANKEPNATIYSGEFNVDGTYYPTLAYVQFSHSIFLVPKDQWKEKLLHFCKSNLFVFDFTKTHGFDLQYSPTELGNTALFVLKREYDGLPYYLEPQSLLSCIFKNNRVGRYNVTKQLDNDSVVSLNAINNAVVFDIFEELLDASTQSFFNLSSNNRFQLVKLRKWLIDQINQLGVNVKVPKILAKVTHQQIKKFSEFLYEESYYEQLYPMSAIVLLIIESFDLIDIQELQQEQQLLQAFESEPSALISQSINVKMKNLASHLLQFPIPGCDYNCKVLLEEEQELNKLSNFNKRSKFLVSQWYELLCKYQCISQVNEEAVDIWQQLQGFLLKSYILPNSVKDFASTFASYITSTQASIPRKFDKIIVVFEQGMSIDEVQSLKEIGRKYNLENQLICIADQIL